MSDKRMASTFWAKRVIELKKELTHAQKSLDSAVIKEDVEESKKKNGTK